MWDLPRPGVEPVSPALAGRFSTTVPPGKPQEYWFDVPSGVGPPKAICQLAFPSLTPFTLQFPHALHFTLLHTPHTHAHFLLRLFLFFGHAAWHAGS